MAGLSPADIAAPVRSVLSRQKNASVLLAEVQGIDVEGRAVTTSAGVLRYDALVVAAGAENDHFGHTDWARSAPGLKTIEDAIDIRRRVLLAFEKAEERRITGASARPDDLTFVVIGGGPTGVELAGAIAELARFALARDFRGIDPRSARVVLVEGGARILAAFPDSLSEKGRRQLAELGVEVKTGVRVKDIDGHGVELEGGERIGAAVVLWGAGVRASPLGAALAHASSRAAGDETFALDRQGRVPVESDCSLPHHRDVFVLGDMAAFRTEEGTFLPGLSPVALQQGRFVARVIAQRVQGLEEGGRPRFRYVDKGTMATIGRSRAVAWAGPLRVSGFIAWLMWLFVHIWFLITFRNRVAVLFNWAWSYVTYKRGARLITAAHPAA
jgi:NADH dehydrogenase